jgi:hypothetical protein
MPGYKNKKAAPPAKKTQPAAKCNNLADLAPKHNGVCATLAVCDQPVTIVYDLDGREIVEKEATALFDAFRHAGKVDNHESLVRYKMSELAAWRATRKIR